VTFDEFQFQDDLMEGLRSMGFSKATPIQELAIPTILAGKDLIACAQTGTGKTAAYLLPTMQLMLKAEKRHCNTLIIAPTRELAQQIDNQVQGIAYFCGISSIAVYGGGDGMAWEQQKKAMLEGADIIIATPGRLIAQLQNSSLDLSNLQHLILDEADRMLDMGFYDDILRIISYLPEKRQTLLFSATMPPKIRTLAHKILQHPEQINISLSKPAEGVTQQAYMAFDTQKLQLLSQILKTGDYSSIIIFAGTKEKVKSLEREVQRIIPSSKSFHSDLEQAEREEIMRLFRNKQLRVLIGTDILSRGIDVEGISLVVNYDVPGDPEDYIHRIGRTARAEKTGTAITFINEKDQQKFLRIEQLIEKEIEKIALPEFLGEAPLYQPNVRPAFDKKRKGPSKGRFPQNRRPGA